MTLISTIRSRPDIAEILSWPFGFQVDDGGVSVRRPQLAGERAWRLVARDGTGGEYLVAAADHGGDGALVYVSVDGRAGVIAADLAEGLALVLSLPTWRHVLKYSAGGSLEAMRAAAPGLEAELVADEAGLETRRAAALDALGLVRLADPVGLLYRNVIEHTGTHRAADVRGQALASLFGG